MIDERELPVFLPIPHSPLGCRETMVGSRTLSSPLMAGGALRLGVRRALIVGIADFIAAPAASAAESDWVDEEYIGQVRWRPIPGADDWAAQVSAALEDLGYRVTLLTGDASPGSGELGAAVCAVIRECEADDVLIVHVITHGDESPETDTVHAVGADGQRHELSDVDVWLRSVAGAAGDSPQTLFLLDFCRSGGAAAPRWLKRPFRASNRCWVLAASAPGEDAFNCSFSQAVVTALREVAAGDFVTHPSRPAVPYLAVTSRIRELMVGGRPDVHARPFQDPTGTPIDTMEAARLHLPFFTNPDHRQAAFDEALVDVADRLAEFVRELDHLVDARHFRDRAAGRRDAGRRPGVFQGRRRELTELSAWMNGAGTASPRIVTGSPGVGKSAVLGVLVCAAHPVLRSPTEEVWGHLPAPSANPHLAAVHARQASVDAVVESIAAQLSFGARSVPDLLTAVVRADKPPVIVIDALDEALNAGDLCARLLVPLASAHRPDGEGACRLLVGMRPWREFGALQAATRQAGGSILDLDETPVDEIRSGLRTYVERVLPASDWYGSIDGQRFVTPLAERIAEVLAQPSGPGEERWGGYLIASLFTDYLIRTFPRITEHAAVDRLASVIPTTLPAVLEMSLRQPTGAPWLRPVLAAVAHARGEGMPPTLIRALAPLYATGMDLGQPSMRDVRKALGEGRFFLRQSADIAGNSVFRLFHEGLAEYLRARPVDSAVLAT
ncbi:hypothetical protein [Streptomyces sp. NPDC004629]|uniref:hypothetical protein n=1 Tax=Streptomyces sp. NPDC004629 TaxID=3364705 RepID=UPI0036CB919A